MFVWDVTHTHAHAHTHTHTHTHTRQDKPSWGGTCPWGLHCPPQDFYKTPRKELASHSPATTCIVKPGVAVHVSFMVHKWPVIYKQKINRAPTGLIIGLPGSSALRCAAFYKCCATRCGRPILRPVRGRFTFYKVPDD
jgi:hypothetical protein